jgi:N-acyl-D-aspartate/D-glutamate deacylase
VLTLEKAIWRLSGHPASVFGLRGRGRIQPGFVADLVAFDPTTVGVGQMERMHDLPAHADRLIARSRGIAHLWVNGERVVVDGDDVPTRPGVLIRDGGRRRAASS